MVCNECGHNNGDHKSVTSAMFYCGICNSVEQNVTFSVDAASAAGNNADPSKSDDVQADMYRSFKRLARPRYE